MKRWNQKIKTEVHVDSDGAEYVEIYSSLEESAEGDLVFFWDVEKPCIILPPIEMYGGDLYADILEIIKRYNPNMLFMEEK